MKNITPSKILHVKSIDQFAQEISSAWQSALESVVEVAQLCADADETLSRIELIELKSKLQMGNSTFSMLLGIAERTWITGDKYRAQLPNSYATLYQLSRLEEKTFETAARVGTIKPDMQRKDAIALRPASQKSSGNKAKLPVLLTIRIADENLSDADILEVKNLVNKLNQSKLISIELSTYCKKIMKSSP